MKGRHDDLVSAADGEGKMIPPVKSSEHDARR
jgi:hypothetical protein